MIQICHLQYEQLFLSQNDALQSKDLGQRSCIVVGTPEVSIGLFSKYRLLLFLQTKSTGKSLSSSCIYSPSLQLFVSLALSYSIFPGFRDGSQRFLSALHRTVDFDDYLLIFSSQSDLLAYHIIYNSCYWRLLLHYQLSDHHWFSYFLFELRFCETPSLFRFLNQCFFWLNLTGTSYPKLAFCFRFFKDSNFSSCFAYFSVIWFFASASISIPKAPQWNGQKVFLISFSLLPSPNQNCFLFNFAFYLRQISVNFHLSQTPDYFIAYQSQPLYCDTSPKSIPAIVGVLSFRQHRTHLSRLHTISFQESETSSVSLSCLQQYFKFWRTLLNLLFINILMHTPVIILYALMLQKAGFSKSSIEKEDNSQKRNEFPANFLIFCEDG